MRFLPCHIKSPSFVAYFIHFLMIFGETYLHHLWHFNHVLMIFGRACSNIKMEKKSKIGVSPFSTQLEFIKKCKSILWRCLFNFSRIGVNLFLIFRHYNWSEAHNIFLSKTHKYLMCSVVFCCFIVWLVKYGNHCYKTSIYTPDQFFFKENVIFLFSFLFFFFLSFFFRVRSLQWFYFHTFN